MDIGHIHFACFFCYDKCCQNIKENILLTNFKYIIDVSLLAHRPLKIFIYDIKLILNCKKLNLI